MKKLLALSAMTLAASSALAQSSVTLYGIADAGVWRASGIRGGSDTRLASGIMEGSRWGLRGNEDIGGGYRAVFTLENRFELNDGSLGSRPPSGSQLPDRLTSTARLGLPGALAPAVAGVAASIGSTLGVNLSSNIFDRQAFVGLVTPVGAVLAGRQYTPGFEVNAAFDIMETQSSLAVGQLVGIPAGLDIRYNNTIQYRVQTGPFTANVMYGFGTIADDRKKNQLMGGMAMYRTDGFSFGLGYNTRNNELAKKSLTSTVLGASYKFGGSKISVLAGQIKDENPSNLSTISATLQGATPAVPAAFANLVQAAFVEALKQDGRLYQIGYRFSTGANTLSVAYNRFDDRQRTGTNDTDVDSYGFVYTYSLSRRSDLNLVVTRFNNKNLGQAAPGGNGFLGGVSTSAGTDVNNYAFGLRHRF